MDSALNRPFKEYNRAEESQATPAAGLLDPSANAAVYAASVLSLYIDLPETPLRASTLDQRFVRRLFDDGVPLALVETAPLFSEAPWKEDQLRRIKDRVESFGLKAGNLMLHDFRDAILGRPGADKDIEKVSESIRVAGKVGIPIVEYNWYSLRAMGGYYKEPGRGGTLLAAHDYDRSRDLPVLPDVGEHSADQLWPRYERFLKAVAPVAKRAGVRLAVQPNDPPPPRYRGTDQILGSVDGLKRVCDTVKSPANGITFDTGVTREMGFNVIENIEWFGKRDQSNHVHFRSVLDAGDNDMLACLRALHSTGYPRLLHPGHVPELPGDPAGRGGWGYAAGQIKAMMRQL